MRSKRRLITIGVGLAGLIAAVPLYGAQAAPSPIVLTNPSPLAHCPGLPGTVTNFTAEPHMAVNPTNDKNLVVAWQQDRSYGARGSVVTSSQDGGHTWKEVTVPGADTCSTGQVAVADPWLTFDGAGTVYLASLAGRPNAQGQVVASLIVNRSPDGGRTWSEPSRVTNFETFDDKPSITADPHRAGVVYATWDRPGNCGTSPCPSQVQVARSTDGGRTWSEPQLVASRPTLRQHNARMLVLPNGHLRLFYFQSAPTAPTPPASITRELQIVDSADGGASWGTPRPVVSYEQYVPADPTGRRFKADINDAIAVGPRGDLYVVTAENTSASSDHPSAVKLRASTDGGATWGEPQTVATPSGHSSLPGVAVNAKGRVAVTWYDFADDRPGDAEFTMAYRAAERHGGQAGWHQRTLSRFDAFACGHFSPPGLPGPKLPWVGEYYGLVPVNGDRFGTAYPVCAPVATVGVSDIVFSTF